MLTQGFLESIMLPPSTLVNSSDTRCSHPYKMVQYHVYLSIVRGLSLNTWPFWILNNCKCIADRTAVFCSSSFMLSTKTPPRTPALYEFFNTSIRGRRIGRWSRTVLFSPDEKSEFIRTPTNVVVNRRQDLWLLVSGIVEKSRFMRTPTNVVNGSHDPWLWPT